MEIPLMFHGGKAKSKVKLKGLIKISGEWLKIE
jgi:hypothetical protein